MRMIIALLVFALPAAAAEPSRLTAAARAQVGVTLTYDPAYTRPTPGWTFPAAICRATGASVPTW